jgi:hypothetical protein
MKQITAFECEYCGKILKTKHAMKTHEPKCFVNPESKSCITCQSFVVQNCINGKPISDNEELIMQYKVEGTFHINKGDMECDDNELNDNYKYLYDSEPENCCNSLKCVLKKLRTQCPRHEAQ